MASQLYRIRQGATATVSGRELIDVMNQLGDAFGMVRRVLQAMTEQQDGTVGDASDFVTVATVFGFVDAVDALSPEVAMAAYAEINSFVGNGGPALLQCTARFKQ